MTGARDGGPEAAASAPAALAPGGEAVRRLPFAGAVNFRDLGGYAAGGGRRVRWRRLYRSDSLADLTAADVARLEELGLGSLCDFRLESERALKPNRLPPGHRIRLHTISFAPGGLIGLFAALRTGRLGGAEVEQLLATHYRQFPLAHAAEYRRMFEVLLQPDAYPVLIHCTSGKDRTGFGAAMILLALGVPRETIIEDYTLTSQYRRDISQLLPAHLDAGIIDALTQAHPSYLEAAFRVIDARWGSGDAFLARALGLGEAERAALAALLLEEVPGDAPG